MSTSESNPSALTCRFHGQAAIREASEAARSFGAEQMLDEDELARLCIVIEELVANLFDHGGLGVDDQIELGLAVVPEGIRVSICDKGAPFDPWSALPKDERPDRGGGAGIGIVKAWAHLIAYRATDEGNQLQFLLPIRWDR
jgi:anti-sigma regulatory factor (Ser/Thr protein kinase)